MIVLDTNVVSELMRPEPDEAVVAWVDRQVADDVFLTAVTLAELLYGVARLPEWLSRMFGLRVAGGHGVVRRRRRWREWAAHMKPSCTIGSRS